VAISLRSAGVNRDHRPVPDPDRGSRPHCHPPRQCGDDRGVNFFVDNASFKSENLAMSYFHDLDKTELIERAIRPHSAIPHPFLKWAGSKRFVLKHLIEVLPRSFKVYREPFLGSGALFFLLRPKSAVLSDTCPELIDTFVAVRDNNNMILRFLAKLTPEKKLFYFIRNHHSKGRFKRAAEFIYLNKTCWNGLYRVNASGNFNVPFGSKHPKTVADPTNLRVCAQLLNGPEICLEVCDFEHNLKEAGKGDLVYLDPPYVTSHYDNGFIEYNEQLFSWDDQVRLAELARQAQDRGACVVISNANDKRVIRLYKGFKIKHFTRKSTLASDKTKRTSVVEAIIYSG
jgi:DNA adenine methylase